MPIKRTLAIALAVALLIFAAAVFALREDRTPLRFDAAEWRAAGLKSTTRYRMAVDLKHRVTSERWTLKRLAEEVGYPPERTARDSCSYDVGRKPNSSRWPYYLSIHSHDGVIEKMIVMGPD